MTETAPENENLQQPDLASSSSTPSKASDDNQHSIIREFIGSTMHSFSDTINDNMVAARYGVFAGVLLLTAYGVSNTPLFFRFRTVSEIPASYFVNRRRLYGRIICVNKSNSNNERSLEVHIRHLSPVGQVLPKVWYDFFMRASPLAARLAQSRSTQKPEESKSELLRIKIAGVQYPPLSQFDYKAEEYLEKLAKDRSLVSCQLLARQVPVLPSDDKMKKGKRRDIFPSLEESNEKSIMVDNDNRDEHLAICKLSHRPTLLQLFSSDIGLSLILAGNAEVSSSMISSTNTSSNYLDNSYDEDNTERVKQTELLDSSQRVDDLRKDVKYLEELSRAELEAVKSKRGIWAFPEVRETKFELVEEIEFQANANIFQKLWRRLRG